MDVQLQESSVIQGLERKNPKAGAGLRCSAAGYKPCSVPAPQHRPRGFSQSLRSVPGLRAVCVSRGGQAPCRGWRELWRGAVCDAGNNRETRAPRAVAKPCSARRTERPLLPSPSLSSRQPEPTPRRPSPNTNTSVIVSKSKINDGLRVASEPRSGPSHVPNVSETRPAPAANSHRDTFDS